MSKRFWRAMNKYWIRAFIGWYNRYCNETNGQFDLKTDLETQESTEYAMRSYYGKYALRQLNWLALRLSKLMDSFNFLILQLCLMHNSILHSDREA